jgi:hypothetical protein
VFGDGPLLLFQAFPNADAPSVRLREQRPVAGWALPEMSLTRNLHSHARQTHTQSPAQSVESDSRPSEAHVSSYILDRTTPASRVSREKPDNVLELAAQTAAWIDAGSPYVRKRQRTDNPFSRSSGRTLMEWSRSEIGDLSTTISEFVTSHNSRIRLTVRCSSHPVVRRVTFGEMPSELRYRVGSGL